MIATRPISEFIVSAYNNKNIIKSPSMNNRIENLFNIISSNLHSKPLEVIAESLQDKLFELRLEFLDWFGTNSQNKNLSNEFQEKIDKEIRLKAQLSSYSNLAFTVTSALNIYEQIVSPMLKKYEEVREGVPGDNKPTYADVKKEVADNPSPKIQYQGKLLLASLNLDFGFIVADFVLTNQLKLSKEENEKLIEFINAALVHFGAYSIFTGSWQPDKNDTSDLINKMGILAATIELDNKMYAKTITTTEELYNLIHH